MYNTCKHQLCTLFPLCVPENVYILFVFLCVYVCFFVNEKKKAEVQDKQNEESMKEKQNAKNVPFNKDSMKTQQPTVNESDNLKYRANKDSDTINQPSNQKDEEKKSDEDTESMENNLKNDEVLENNVLASSIISKTSENRNVPSTPQPIKSQIQINKNDKNHNLTDENNDSYNEKLHGMCFVLCVKIDVCVCVCVCVCLFVFGFFCVFISNS